MTFSDHDIIKEIIRSMFLIMTGHDIYHVL